MDWLWNMLVAPLPDMFTPEWFAALRDVLSVGLAALGAYLVWLSIKMGREQDAVTARQVDILERLEKLEERQADAAERQQRLMDADRLRKAVLKLEIPRPNTAASPSVYKIFIANRGDREQGGYWYLGVPKRLSSRVNFQTHHGHEKVQVATDGTDILNSFDNPLVACFTDDYQLLKCQAVEPVAAGDLRPCGTIWVTWENQEHKDPNLRTLLWFTNGPGGRFPETGMMKLKLYRRTEASFKNYHGGIEPPPDSEDHVTVSPGP